MNLGRPLPLNLILFNPPCRRALPPWALWLAGRHKAKALGPASLTCPLPPFQSTIFSSLNTSNRLLRCMATTLVQAQSDTTHQVQGRAARCMPRMQTNAQPMLLTEKAPQTYLIQIHANSFQQELRSHASSYGGLFRQPHPAPLPPPPCPTHHCPHCQAPLRC